MMRVLYCDEDDVKDGTVSVAEIKFASYDNDSKTFFFNDIDDEKYECKNITLRDSVYICNELLRSGYYDLTRFGMFS